MAARKRCWRLSPMPAVCICTRRRLVLPHPSGKGELKVQAEPPPHFRRTVEAFGFSTTGD